MSEVFQTILSMSIGASVLALLMLGARAIIGRRQTVVLTILFAMLVARLVVPLSIESRVSIFNILPQAVAQQAQIDAAAGEGTIEIGQGGEAVQPDVLVESDAAAMSATDGNEATDALPVFEAGTSDAVSGDGSAVAQQQAQADTAQVSTDTSGRTPLSLIEILTIVWLAGMGVMATVIGASNISFMRKVRRNRVYTAPGFDEMLSQCADELRIRQRITAVRMSDINTVAVCGIIRPKILIAPQVFDALSEREKRHVIMHELGHIKRKDTLVCLILTFVNILHWFNPIVWVSFALMRKDLEIMCDGKVLRGMEQGERNSYAKTLLALVSKTGTKRNRLAMAMFMSRAVIKRRIAMIAKYKRNRPIAVALALVLAVGIAITGCTVGVQEMPAENAAELSKYEQPNQPGIPDEASWDKQPGIIGAFTLDFSAFADEENIVSNINRAAEYFDGRVLSTESQSGILEITKENGWKEAPTLPLDTVDQVNRWGEFISIEEVLSGDQTMRIGGGFEIVMIAVSNAAWVANIEMSSGHYDSFSYGMKHYYVSDVTIHAQVQGNTITVEFYCDNPTEMSFEAIAAVDGIKVEMIGSYSLNLADHDVNDARLANIEQAIRVLNRTRLAPGQGFSLMYYIGELTQEHGWKVAPSYSWEGISGINDTGEWEKGPGIRKQIGGGIDLVAKAIWEAADDSLEPGILCKPNTGLSEGDLTATNYLEMEVFLKLKIQNNHIVASFYTWEEEPTELPKPTKTTYDDEEPEFVPQITYKGEIGSEHLTVDEAKSLVIEYCEILYGVTLEKPLMSAGFELPGLDFERATWAVFTERIWFRIDATTGSIINYFNSHISEYAKKDSMSLERTIRAEEEYYSKAEDVVVKILGNDGVIEDMFVDGIQEVYIGHEPVSYQIDVWAVMETGSCYIISFVGDEKIVSGIMSFATKEDLFAGNDIG